MTEVDQCLMLLIYAVAREAESSEENKTTYRDELASPTPRQDFGRAEDDLQQWRVELWLGAIVRRSYSEMYALQHQFLQLQTFCESKEQQIGPGYEE